MQIKIQVIAFGSSKAFNQSRPRGKIVQIGLGIQKLSPSLISPIASARMAARDDVSPGVQTQRTLVNGN
jgi:hypothetical protein